MNPLRSLTGRLVISGIAIGLMAAPAEERRLQQQTERLHEVSLADYSMAVQRLEVDGKWHEGVALLAQALHSWPENPQAATRLYSTLSLHAPEQQCWPRLVLNGGVGVWSAQYSADGNRILTISEDRAQVWDAVTAKPVGKRIEDVDSEAMARFSADGSRLVITHRSHSFEVLDVATGRRIGEAMVHERVNSADFSPDGSRIVSISDDHSVQVWDVATQQSIGARMTHEGLVGDVDFSPDGRFIVTASEDKTVRVWDAGTGKPLGKPVLHEHAVRSVEFSPVDLRVLTTCADGSSRVWNLELGKFVGKPMCHLDAVNDAHFSPDGALVLTASRDRTAQLWAARTGRPHAGPLRHESEVQHAKFSADGRYVVTTDLDGIAWVWETTPAGVDVVVGSLSDRYADDLDDDRDVAGGRVGGVLRKPLGALLKHGNGDGVLEASFSPDGRQVLTAGSSGPALVWDAPTGMVPGEPLRLSGGGWFGGGNFHSPSRNEGVVTDVVLSPDGTHLIMLNSRTSSAQLWDLTTGRLTSAPLKRVPADMLGGAEFSRDGRLVVATGFRKPTAVWDVATGRDVCSLSGLKSLVLGMNFSPDGKRVLTAAADGTAQVWSVETGHYLFRPMRHEGNVFCAEYSRDGKRIVTGGADGAARVWDGLNGMLLMKALLHANGEDVKTKRLEVHTAHFSADGTRIVTACSDGAARVWDAATGARVGAVMTRRMSRPLHVGDEELLRRPWRQAAGVLSAEFSPDGRRVVTALSDDTAQVWDAATGDPVGAPLGKPGWDSTSENCAMYSPDGTLILTTHADGKARLWDAATGLPLGDPLDHGRSGPDAGTYRTTPNACFSVDGTRIVTSGIDEVARVWHVPPPVARLVPVPQWMLHRACAIAGMEHEPDGGMRTLVPEARRAAVLATLPEDAGASISGGEWSRMARWLALPAQERTLTPESKFTRRQIAERERDSCDWIDDSPILSDVALESALRYDPTTPLAHLMLAGALTGGWSGRAAGPTADMLQRHGLQFLPEKAALWSRAARIMLAEGNDTLALQAAEKALKLDPNNKEAQKAKVSAEDGIKRSTQQQ